MGTSAVGNALQAGTNVVTTVMDTLARAQHRDDFFNIKRQQITEEKNAIENNAKYYAQELDQSRELNEKIVEYLELLRELALLKEVANNPEGIFGWFVLKFL